MLKEALATATLEEMEELERLTMFQRSTVTRRTMDEILHEMKRRELSDNLRKSIAEYVEFYS